MVFIWFSQVSREFLITPKNLVLLTLGIFILSIYLSIVRFSLQYELIDWKCLNVVLLVLRRILVSLSYVYWHARMTQVCLLTFHNISRCDCNVERRYAAASVHFRLLRGTVGTQLKRMRWTVDEFHVICNLSCQKLIFSQCLIHYL